MDEVIGQRDDFKSKWQSELSKVADLEKENQKLLDERSSEGNIKEDLCKTIKS